jgi:amino acid adenylation domain-containing protein
MIVAQLGIMKAGGTYVPLDLGHPESRLQYMIENAEIGRVVSQGTAREQLKPHGRELLCLDEEWEKIAAYEDTPLPSLTHPENLAYVIYTSGSSGQPKASMIIHQAVASMAMDSDYMRLQATDRMAQVTNSSFDISMYEIFGALLNGATLVIFDQETVLDPGELAQAMVGEGITSMFMPTAIFNQLAATAPECFSALRYVTFGGEAADVHAVQRVLPHAARGSMVNLYGPTEVTSYCTYFPILDVGARTENIPIGQAIPNAQALVLDPAMELCPLGVEGELYMGGMGVARGYLSQPELTAERFVPHPFSQNPGERLYRTGDKVRWRADGNLEYRGRMDFQVKLRGYRIELGEIEAALSECAGVKQARVVAREDQPGDKRLVAYLVAAEEIQTEQLRDGLKQRLPEYMVPSAFVLLEALPLTPHGKLDYKRLPLPEREGGENYIAPRTEVEEKLADIWRQVLAVDRVGVEDNFFELGGHSLLATQVISRMQDAFQKNLPVRRLFESPTIAELARSIESLLEPDVVDDLGDLSLPPIERIDRAADL